MLFCDALIAVNCGLANTSKPMICENTVPSCVTETLMLARPGERGINSPFASIAKTLAVKGSYVIVPSFV